MKIQWKTVSIEKVRSLSAGLAHHEHPRPLPGSKYLVHRISGDNGSGFILTDSKGRLAHPLLLGPGEFGPLAILSSGTQGLYAYRESPNDHWMIRSLRLPEGSLGEDVFQVGGPGTHLKDPVASPSEESFVFASDETSKGQFHLWELAPRRNEKRPLTSDPVRSDDQPAISPRGRFIAFRGTSDEQADLYLLDQESLKVRRLTAGEGASGEPSFLDDFRLIFSRKLPGGDSGLLLLDILAGREKWITGVLHRAGQPCVLPKGKKRFQVFFTAETRENSSISKNVFRGTLLDLKRDPSS